MDEEMRATTAAAVVAAAAYMPDVYVVQQYVQGTLKGKVRRALDDFLLFEFEDGSRVAMYLDDGKYKVTEVSEGVIGGMILACMPPKFDYPVQYVEPIPAKLTEPIKPASEGTREERK